MTLGQWLGVLGLAALVISITYLLVADARSAAQRRAALRAWAAASGMIYSKGPTELDRLAPHDMLPLPVGTDDQRATNVVRGRRGRFDVAVFEVARRSTHLKVGEADRYVTRTSISTAAVFASAELDLPQFHCVVVGKAFAGLMERALTSAAALGLATTAASSGLGGESALADLHPARFLRAPDAEAVRRVFTPSLLALLETLEGMAVVGDGQHVLVEYAGTLDVGALDGFLANATAITDRLAAASTPGGAA